MAQWKLGYVNNLDQAASEIAGKALYNGYTIATLAIDAATVNRDGGYVTGVSTVTLTDSNASYDTDEYNNGFIRMLSGDCEGNSYEVVDTTATTLVLDTDIEAAGVDVNDYYEVVEGSTSFVWPSGRNPIASDWKRVGTNQGIRYPYYDGGIVTPIGFNPDNLVVTGKFESETDIRNLVDQLTHILDYQGFDAHMSGDEIAPMILQMGTQDADHQLLVWVDDYKVTRNAMRPGIYEYVIVLSNYGRVTTRGM